MRTEKNLGVRRTERQDEKQATSLSGALDFKAPGLKKEQPQDISQVPVSVAFEMSKWNQNNYTFLPNGILWIPPPKQETGGSLFVLSMHSGETGFSGKELTQTSVQKKSNKDPFSISL